MRHREPSEPSGNLNGETPPEVFAIIQGLVDRQPGQWFRKNFRPEDVRMAHALLLALDATL